MAKLTKKRSHKTGLAPGTLVFAGEHRLEETQISAIDYDAESFSERKIETLEEAFALKDSPTVSWLNVNGVHDVGVIQRLGDHFGIHPLVLEDIVHTGQRPKMEEHDDFVYLVVRMLYYDEKLHQLQSEQVSLILGARYVISFQETEGDVFNSVRDRLRNAIGRIRKKGADYLAYALLDVIIDHYFIVLESMSTQTEELEAVVIENPTDDTMREIGMLRRELILLRKAVWPVRDLLSGLEKAESKLIGKEIRPFIRDAHDHAVQVIEIVESLRDLIGVLRDSYQSVLGNRMNAIMKVLTIIATIFIPLTFIAGIYGMNFENMPELRAPYGYPIALAAMASIGLGLAFYFRHKKWI